MTEAALEVDENMPPSSVNNDVIEGEVLETTEITESAPATEELGDNPAAPGKTYTEEEAQALAQDRINKITAKRGRETRRADALEVRLAELEAQNKAPEAAEPKLEDFDYDEAQFNIELVKYHSKKAASEAVSSIRTEQQQATDNARQTEINNGFNARVEDFRASAPDYDSVIAGLPDLPSDVLDAIMTNEKGPQLAHYLGKHLDVADNINLMKLGEISAQLATTKPIKAPSAAPKPIDPVKPGGTLNKNLEDMSTAEVGAYIDSLP